MCIKTRPLLLQFSFFTPQTDKDKKRGDREGKTYISLILLRLCLLFSWPRYWDTEIVVLQIYFKEQRGLRKASPTCDCFESLLKV